MFDNGLTSVNSRYFWLNLAYLCEWVVLFVVAFVEFIAWIVALTSDPMFFVIWAYVCLWLSFFLYGLPVFLLIVHAFKNGT